MINVLEDDKAGTNEGGICVVIAGAAVVVVVGAVVVVVTGAAVVVGFSDIGGIIIVVAGPEDEESFLSTNRFSSHATCVYLYIFIFIFIFVFPYV